MPPSVLPKKLGHGTLGVTPTLIYTVPADKPSATIRSINAANVDPVSTRGLTVWLVPEGDVPTDDNALCKNLLVQVNGVAQDDAVHVLMTGGSVYGQTGAPGMMTLTVDGAENQP